MSFGIVAGLSIVLNEGSFRALGPMVFVTGIEYYDRHTGLLTGPIPWTHITISILAAALLMGLSVKMIQRREF